MTTEKMTVHKALAELKLLDDRITRAIKDCEVCRSNKHSNDKIEGLSIDEYKKNIQSKYDKANDLIKRRKAIKRAVVLSNAQTNVNINDIEYTVAEAIEMKNKGVYLEVVFKDWMERKLNEAKAEINLVNGGLEERANQYVTAIYGAKEGNTKAEDIEKVKNDFYKSNQYEIIDPLNVQDKIDELEESINSFMSEVDAALSVSNALTEITIEY